jgi:hypothetical protein
MSKAQAYLGTSIFGVPNPRALLGTRTLTPVEALYLEQALNEDRQDYLYNAILSFGEGVSGLGKDRFSWATVKFYYTVYYALRATLCSQRVALFYLGRTPCSIRASAGSVARKEKDNTHKAVIALFKSACPSSLLLTQPIGTEDALEWMIARREEANYTIARFGDPVPPAHFRLHSRLSVRRFLAQYMADNRHLYTFDPDHAMIAFPLQVILADLAHSGAICTEEEKRHLLSVLCDRHGRFAELLTTLAIG